LAGLLVLRVIVGGAVHLTEDEAYYRLWSMTPAFGYYDHPPMIAWWIWAGRHVVGDSPLGVRLAPILGAAATSLLVYDLARQAGGEARTAERAAIWYNAMPLIAGGGFLAVPDAPASLFWTLTLCCVFRALSAKTTLWWIAAGTAAGLALLSKYSALFLGPGIFLWLVCTPRHRRQLLGPGPWLAAIVAAAIFGLNVVWNAEHHWLTFAKQFGRVAATHLAPGHLAEFGATQMLLVNPLLAVFLLRRPPGVRGARGAGDVDLLAFVATSAPFVFYLVIHSLHDRVQAHWPAPVYPALAICSAAAAARMDSSRVWARLRLAVPVVGFTVCALALALVLIPAGALGPKFDPASPVRGWPEFASRLERLRTDHAAAWVGTTSYGLAAELADEPGIRAPVLQLAERDRYEGLKLGAGPDFARPGLVVDLPRRIDLSALGQCFANVQPLGALARGGGGGAAGKAYAVVLVSTPLRDVLGEGC
jgi:4-amino-4-deoxy-L-arabinose transferase-like glycosyltransferase